jgi:hypothetical protein
MGHQHLKQILSTNPYSKQYEKHTSFTFRFSANFSAKQSYDGYQILVTFHQKRFYNRFYEQLRMKYVDISWRYDDVHHVTEGKISYSEDDWVSLVISDDFEGSPIMIVMRERSAVEWMQKEYEDIVSTIPG